MGAEAGGPRLPLPRGSSASGRGGPEGRGGGGQREGAVCLRSQGRPSGELGVPSTPSRRQEVGLPFPGRLHNLPVLALPALGWVLPLWSTLNGTESA